MVLGSLDREKASHHDLVIVASDGDQDSQQSGTRTRTRTGTSPSSSTLRVQVQVQDLNDNAPVFRRQRYFATLPADAAPGREVLRVDAEDADDGDNARVTYSLNRRQSSAGAAAHFNVDADTGALRLARPLPGEMLESGADRKVLEIVVVATDGGEVAQESSAFVTIRLTGGGDDASHKTKATPASSSPKATLNLVYPPGIDSVPEDTQVGAAVAQLRFNGDFGAFDLEIEGSKDFTLLRNSSGFYLAVASGLDYEEASTISVNVVAKDPLDPSASIWQTFDVAVGDVNEYPPVFERTHVDATLDESSEPGTFVTRVHADDRDGGSAAGAVRYSLLYSYGDAGSFADGFTVDEDTGEVRTQTRLECEDASSSDSALLSVVASDGGRPSLSATATVSVSVVDSNDNAPVFADGYYSAGLSEDARPGECFLKVEATDADCGPNAVVSYLIKDGDGAFSVGTDSGEVCLRGELDRETQDVYSFTILATDKGNDFFYY